MKLLTRVLLPAALATLVVGCNSAQQTASKTAARVANAVSPIAGTWKIAGDTPPPKANLPQFVILDFQADGKLEASYVAAGGALAKVIDTPSKLKSEHDTYMLAEGNRLSIIEGSRSLDYTYDVRDGKLFLKAPDDATETVYQKS